MADRDPMAVRCSQPELAHFPRLVLKAFTGLTTRHSRERVNAALLANLVNAPGSLPIAPEFSLAPDG